VPFTNLTKQDQPNQLEWGEAQDRAFENLKSHIVNHPIVRLPEFEKQFIFQTDACNSGIGAILLQEDFAVGCLTPQLLTSESHYSPIEKECLAIVWAVQTFQNFLSHICAVSQYAELEANGKVNGIGEIAHPSDSQTLGTIWMTLQIYHYVRPES